MEIFTNPLYRDVLLEIVKHVQPSSIEMVSCLNRLTWKLCKEDPTLHEIVVNKQSDLFIDVYERKYYANHTSSGEYVERRALGFRQGIGYLQSVIKCVGTLYNSILIECIRQTRNMEMVLNLRKRCILNGAKFLEDELRTVTYIPKNCVLALHSIVNGKIDMLMYFVNLAENDDGWDELDLKGELEDERDGNATTRPTKLYCAEIDGRPGYYRDINYNFIVHQLEDGTLVALGVCLDIGGSVIRKLTRKDQRLALSIGLAHEIDDSVVDDDNMDNRNSSTNVINKRKPPPSYKFNSASTTDFINVRGFRCLLRARQKLEPTVFKSMLDIFLLHPVFKCDETTIGIALSEHYFELFDILRSKCDLESGELNKIIQASAFSHRILEMPYGNTNIPVEFSEHGSSSVQTQFVCFSNLIRFSPISIVHHTRIQIPFPVAYKNVKSLLNCINMLTQRSLHFGACENLQDLTDFRKLLDFFQIKQTALNESNPKLMFPSE